MLRYLGLDCGQPVRIPKGLWIGYQQCTGASLEHVQLCSGISPVIDETVELVVVSCQDAWYSVEEQGACGQSQCGCSSLGCS